MPDRASAAAPPCIVDALLHGALPLLCGAPLRFYGLRLPHRFELAPLPERLGARSGIRSTLPFDGTSPRPVG